MRHIHSILGHGLALAALTGAAHADILWGVDSSTDSLYRFSSASGSLIETVGPLHPDVDRYTTPVAMAVRPSDGVIFVINNSPSEDAGISRVNPNTGRATLVLEGSFGSLTFDSFGMLYGVGPTGRLAAINTGSDAVISLGGDVLPNLFGMDFNPADGLIYGITWSVGVRAELVKIDPATGLIIDQFEIDRDMPSAPGSLIFLNNGNLVCSTIDSKLFNINTADGSVGGERDADVTPQGMGADQRDCCADFDNDGDLDAEDFFLFLDAFTAGCP